MGVILSKAYEFFSKRNVRCLMVGLDAAGKTTILYKLKLGELVTTIPTIGFNVETVEINGSTITIWDIGGQTKIRALWKHYYAGTELVVFVVDSNDLERIQTAREELHTMLSDEDLRNASLLVFANKQDLPNALRVDEIIERLDLASIKQRTWYIQGCCAKTGAGIQEAFDYMLKETKNQTNQQNKFM